MELQKKAQARLAKTRERFQEGMRDAHEVRSDLVAEPRNGCRQRDSELQRDSIDLVATCNSTNLRD